MSQDFKIQQNVKVGNDLINLRADSPDEFQRIAEWTVANAALFVNVQAALAAVPPALAGNVTNTQVINDAPAAAVQAHQQQAQGGWGGAPQQGQQQGPPSWAAPAAPAQGPACKHGPMEWKDFVSKAGNAVKGHFCTSRDRNDQCPVIYAPKGR